MTEKQPPHVEQALAELDGAANEEQQRAARKRMAAAGYEQATPTRAETTGEPDATERKAPPKGRSTRQEAKGTTA